MGLIADDAKIYLFGSAVRGELRTRTEDPNDPSDIDLLAIVPDESIERLNRLMREGAHLSRTRTDAATSFLIKRPSFSGELNPTEMNVYTATGLQAELRQNANAERTQFVAHAMQEAVLADQLYGAEVA